MRRRIIVVLGFLACLPAVAQQQATYSQYMFNGLAINPAYAGSHEALSATFLSRFQNVGLEGSPWTQTFTAHSPLLNRKVALGLLVIHDGISVIDQTGFHASYAYRIFFDEDRYVSFGLQGGFSSYRAEYSELEQFDPNDPAFAQDLRQTRPNIGAGVYYSTPVWYAGLSMPSMMNNVFDRGTDFQTVYQSVPLMLTGGYVFTLNRMLKIKPNFLFKLVDGRAVEMDLNASLLMDEVLWVGLSYKVNNALNMMLQVLATEQLQVGYSYNITTNKIRTVENGSHEIMVNYRFRYFKHKVVTPRYF
jgi:type IX secretion system PorP/SprF family membrane protein